MQKQRRGATGVADLLPIHDMVVRQRQVAGLVRADIREQFTAGHVYSIRAAGMTEKRQ
jgi:hypothetical protein